MKETDCSNEVKRAGEACAHRLVVIAIFSSLATLLIATFYPSGKPADDLMSLSFSATYSWIAAQSFVLALPGLLIGTSIGTVAPKTGALVGGMLDAVGARCRVVRCDDLQLDRRAIPLRDHDPNRDFAAAALALHVTPSAVMQSIFITAIVLAGSLLVWKASGVIARKWEAREDAVQPLATTMVLSLAAVLTSYSAIGSFSRTASEMERSSTRHPFCAFHIVGYRGVGVPLPSKQGAVLSKLRGLQSIDLVHAREQAQLEIEIDKKAFREGLSAETLPARPKNVIIVVVECLRPEVIDPSVMPNLHAFAQRSIVCSNNFTSGNATCHSMFSLVTGLESVWFRRSVSEQPILNRLLHQAGYELAFYGGQTDWTEYHMDGFINPTQFESFQIEEPDLPGSDLRAIDRTIEFIDRQDVSGRDAGDNAPPGPGTPRAAICYLYATHSRFRYSDPQDRIFLPEASESVLMSRAPELRDQFYNRYKNSLRTMDRMLAPLLRDRLCGHGVGRSW